MVAINGVGHNMIDTAPLGGLHTIVTANRMHEQGHDHYETSCPDRCDLADRWAARNLITPRAFLAAARHAYRIDEVAANLWATPGIVNAYIAGLPPDEWLIMTRLVGHKLV